jgi:hypothetical protein
MRQLGIQVPEDGLAAFCRCHHIRRLAFFGSVLTDAFRSDSDVDVLVVFVPGCEPGFIGLTQMELELAGLLGRRVDLNTPGCFSLPMRRVVEAGAEVLYAAA